MILLSTDTEVTITDIVQQEAEAAKNANPGVIKSYLEKMLPQVLSLGAQIIIALIVYFVGIKIISFARKKIKKWLTKLDRKSVV